MSLPAIYVAWFPGCANADALRCLRDECGVSGIETRYLDADARAIRDAGLSLAFHVPTLPEEPVAMNLATDDVLRPYREGRMARIDESDAPFVSYHCGYSCEHVRKEAGPDLALSPTLDRAETAARIARTVRELAALTGREILIENMDYGPTGALEHVCEPAFIREVCEAAGCGFLLDIAHGVVSAEPLGFSEAAYMESLIRELAPYLREVHINGAQGPRDAHRPATERELRWLHALPRAGCRPRVVTLERTCVGTEGVAAARALQPEIAALRQILERKWA